MILPRRPVKNPLEHGFVGHLPPERILRIVEEQGDRFEVHVNFGTVRYGKTNAKENIIGTSWLPLDLDFKDGLAPSPHEIVFETVLRGLPPPTLVYRTPSGGYRVLWRLKQPAYFDHREPELRTLFISFYEATQKALCEALEDLGADSNAIGIHHMFRIWPAELVFYRSENRTSLSELLKAAREFNRNREKRKRKARLEVTAQESLEKNPAWRWLNGHVYGEGCRNRAFLAYLILAGHGGAFPGEEEALKWVKDHTAPPYPGGEARAVYRCARLGYEAGNFYGISPAKLMALGMPAPIARAALRLGGVEITSREDRLPKGLVKPIEERIHKPRIFRFVQLVEFIAKTGTRRCSARKLSVASGIPFSTLTETLAPVVKLWRGPGETDFLVLNTHPRGLRRASVITSHLKSSVTRDFLIGSLQALFGRSGLDLWRTISYWIRRDGNLWLRLWIAVKHFLSLLVSGSAPPGTTEEIRETPEEALRSLWITLSTLPQGSNLAPVHGGS